MLGGHHLQDLLELVLLSAQELANESEVLGSRPQETMSGSFERPKQSLAQFLYLLNADLGKRVSQQD